MTNSGYEEEIPAGAPRLPRARTPEEAAAIIGGGIKASYLRALARKREIPALWIGKWAFLDEDIAAIIDYCRRPARGTAQSAAPAGSTKRSAKAAPVAPSPTPADELVHIRPRPMRKRVGNRMVETPPPALQPPDVALLQPLQFRKRGKPRTE